MSTVTNENLIGRQNVMHTCFIYRCTLCPVHVSGHVIGTVRCAEDLVFLAMEETVLHAITDRLIDAVG